MPHVSRYRLDKKTEKELVEALKTAFTRIKKGQDMEVFLLSLLSETERLMLAKRLAIVVLLKEGISESNIATALHVTRSTVDRLKLFLESRGQGYEIALRVLEDEKRLQVFKTFLLKLAAYSIHAAGGYVKPGILD